MCITNLKRIEYEIQKNLRSWTKNDIRYLYTIYIVCLFPNLNPATYLPHIWQLHVKKMFSRWCTERTSRSFFSDMTSDFRTIQIPDPHHLFPSRIPPTLQRSWGKFGGRLHNTFRHVQLPKCGGEPVKIWCISKFWRGGPKGMRRVRC